MAKKRIIYRVHVENRRVTIEALKPGSAEFSAVSVEVYRRLRDAIKIKRTLQGSGRYVDETFYFDVLDTAKEFAELVIKDIEERLLDEFVDVLEFA